MFPTDLHEVMVTRALNRFSQPPYVCLCVHSLEKYQHNDGQDFHEPADDLHCQKKKNDMHFRHSCKNRKVHIWGQESSLKTPGVHKRQLYLYHKKRKKKQSVRLLCMTCRIQGAISLTLYMCQQFIFTTNLGLCEIHCTY